MNEEWEMAEFFMKDSFILSQYNSQNRLTKAKDCVINALCLLEIISPRTADLMRILVDSTGVSGRQISNIFEYVHPDFEWKFVPYNDLSTWMRRVESLSPNFCIICGSVPTNQTEAHVFLMKRVRASAPDNGLHFIDPNSGLKSICNSMSEPRCKEYVTQDKKCFYILHCKKKR